MATRASSESRAARDARRGRRRAAPRRAARAVRALGGDDVELEPVRVALRKLWAKMAEKDGAR